MHKHENTSDFSDLLVTQETTYRTSIDYNLVTNKNSLQLSLINSLYEREWDLRSDMST